MKGYIKQRLFLAIFGGILLGSLALSVNVQAEEAKRIRVGYYQMEGFMYRDLADNISGYNMDYLNRIAGYTGWEYEFVEVADMDTGLKLLGNHDIDLMAPCQLTQVILQKYDYSANSFGTQYSVLVTRNNNDDYTYEDFERFNKMQVGVVRDDTPTTAYIYYKVEKHFSTFSHYYPSQQEALTALRAGEVDAAAVNLMMAGNDFKILARFAPEPFYYVTWKGNTELMEELNEAMQSLRNSYPGLENSLMQEYFPLYDAQFISYEEREFVNSLETLRVGYATDRSPISFQDENGEMAGISREIFDRVTDLSGLKFEYVPLPSGNVSYDDLIENDLDLVSGLVYNSTNLNLDIYRLSNAYLTSKKVIVADQRTVFNRDKAMRVAVYYDTLSNMSIKEELEAAYPNFKILFYESVEDCYDAVRKQEAELLIQNQYMVDNWLARPKYENLEIIPVDGLDDNLCFAVITGIDGEDRSETINSGMLLSVINKAISQISKDEMDTILVTGSMDNRYTYTWLDFVYHYKITLVISGILFIFVLAIVIYALRLRSRAKQRQEEEKKKLILQQKRYQIIMEESDEMMYEINLQSGNTTVSDHIMEKFGWTIPNRIDSMEVNDLARIFHIHSSDIPYLKKALDDVVGKSISSEFKVRLLRVADRTYVWCKVACIPLLDDDKQLVSITGKIIDVDAEVKEKERLHQQTRTDGMTGLINKKTFTEDVGEYLSGNSARTSGIVFVDLDHFKDVNDILGHSIGDLAIREAARKLQNIFMDFDIVARFGGDEFCMFVKEIDKDMFEKQLARAIGRMKSVYTDGASTVKVTASIGASFCTSEKIDYQTFLDMADGALYEAKRAGRNRYVFRETA